jgi:uncharacterized protein YqeY
MPTVEEQLREDIKSAMKGGRKDELEVLRTIMADAKNAAISGNLDRSGLPDDMMLKVLRRAVKTREESARMYADAGRTDLADKENFQIGVVSRYLPAAVSEAEVEVVVDTVIVELGAEDKKGMGKVIKETLSRLGGRADGKTVQKVVAGRLS